MQEYVEQARFGFYSGQGKSGHALAAILLGLFAPAIVILVIDASSLSNLGLVLQVYMITIFIAASAAYAVSLLETGEVTSVTIDAVEQLFTIEKSGMLTRAEEAIPFSDVAAVRMEGRYDDDGYETAIPVLVLKSRETVPLPAGTSESDLMVMRRMLLSY